MNPQAGNMRPATIAPMEPTRMTGWGETGMLDENVSARQKPTKDVNGSPIRTPPILLSHEPGPVTILRRFILGHLLTLQV